ncbi:phosphopantetheine-binding protein [Streptomyces sp. NPDC059153]|uniref:phosphopantetheine-binding protein n=1 Tax=unclassified Streptomyces TaxID=2593676 RepID=UPI0036964834
MWFCTPDQHPDLATAPSPAVRRLWITGPTREECARRRAVLDLGLGLDSLALLELVETLQGRLTIVVPDEVTIRIPTVADLQDAVARLVAAALSSAPTPRT